MEREREENLTDSPGPIIGREFRAQDKNSGRRFQQHSKPENVAIAQLKYQVW
jgi:hypothetical protein